MTTILLDTGFLLSIFYEPDDKHDVSLGALQALKGQRVVPAPALAELFWLLNSSRIHLDKRTKYARAVEIVAQIQSRFHIEPLTQDDMVRMIEIMRQYADSRLDYVDTAILAMSERLGCRIICTVDRRDFSIFEPRHVKSFILLPEIL
jgi:uncharacterized protein